MSYKNITSPSPEVAFLRRVGFGVTNDEVTKFNATKGDLKAKVNSWVEHQLNNLPSDVTKMDVASYITADAFYSLNLETTEEWKTFHNDTAKKFSTNGKPSDRPVREHEMLTTLRATHSEFQLFERLSLFWHDHFFVSGDDVDACSLWGSWDRNIRENLLGNFYGMLRRCIEHPAFLIYFGNDINVSGATNENLARELFDSHTLGTSAYFVLDAGSTTPTFSQNDNVPEAWHGQPKGYTDDDVLSAMFMLTGWKINPPTQAGGQFYYHNEESKTSKLTVLDHKYEEKGVNSSAYQSFSIDGSEHARVLKGRHMLHRMATHPATARHIATKLATHFISDQPPKSVIDAVAKTFLDNVDDENQLKKCYMTLFQHEAMRDVSTWGQKKMRPFEMLVSLCRTTECERHWRLFSLTEQATIRHIESTVTGRRQQESEKARQIPTYYEVSQSLLIVSDRLVKAGQRLFDGIEYEGYPDDAKYWSSGDTLIMTLRMLDTAAEHSENNFLDSSSNQDAPLLKVFDITKRFVSDLTPRKIVTFWAKRIWQVEPTDAQLAPYLTFFCAPTQEKWGVWDKDTVITPLDLADRAYGQHKWNNKTRALVVGLFAHPYAQLR